MKLIIQILLVLSLKAIDSFAQSSFPWERPLKMAWSSNGTTFGLPAVFQDSSGVPSAVRWKGDTLVCAFQWFRKPVNSVTWDRVAVKFSYDAGQSWTNPSPIVVTGIPSSYQRPFDPTLAVVSKNSIRIYFSSSPSLPAAGLDATVNTYSAISTDGVHYAFEANPRFDNATKQVIDPAVVYFNGSWHYTAPIGAPQEGAYHATSSNGLDFILQSNIPSDAQHNWTGNLMVNTTGELRFYGSGQMVWFNSSPDGNSWQGFTNTNLPGGDPAVIRISSTSYLAIFVGERYITGVADQNKLPSEISIYPNPIDEYFYVRTSDQTEYHYDIYSLAGQVIQSGIGNPDEAIPVHGLSKGMYILKIKSDLTTQAIKLIK